MEHPQTLTGRRAIVTGGGIGIGLSIVRRFAQAGAKVAFTSHSRPPQDAVEALKAEGLDVIGVQLDATDSAAVDATIDQLAVELGGLDVIVNNAGGIIARVRFEDMTDAHWHTVMNVNVTSAFYVSRAALRHLGRDGRIINISSLAGENGGGNGSGAYATSKAAVDGLTRALAKELGPEGITVNSLAPGQILDTPFHETFTSEADQKATTAGIAVGRPGNPSDVAAAAEYYARVDSGFATGTVLDLNGGAYYS